MPTGLLSFTTFHLYGGTSVHAYMVLMRGTDDIGLISFTTLICMELPVFKQTWY